MSFLDFMGKRIVLASGLLVFCIGMASAHGAMLSENGRLGEKLLVPGLWLGEADANAGRHWGCSDVSKRKALGCFVAPSKVPSQLSAGQAWETQQLANLNLPKNTGVWRPTLQQTDSAAFRVIVGKPKFTPGGLPKGTILDATQGGLLEIKGGSSVLNSSYQLRLQTYRSLVDQNPLTIQTMRPVNQTFGGWLQRWGAKVKPPKSP